MSIWLCISKNIKVPKLTIIVHNAPAWRWSTVLSEPMSGNHLWFYTNSYKIKPTLAEPALGLKFLVHHSHSLNINNKRDIVKLSKLICLGLFGGCFYKHLKRTRYWSIYGQYPMESIFYAYLPFFFESNGPVNGPVHLAKAKFALIYN